MEIFDIRTKLLVVTMTSNIVMDFHKSACILETTTMKSQPEEDSVCPVYLVHTAVHMTSQPKRTRSSVVGLYL